jgi:hypothetical protein
MRLPAVLHGDQAIAAAPHDHGRGLHHDRQLVGGVDRLAGRVDHGAQGGEEGAPGADVAEAGRLRWRSLLIAVARWRGGPFSAG